MELEAAQKLRNVLYDLELILNNGFIDRSMMEKYQEIINHFKSLLDTKLIKRVDKNYIIYAYYITTPKTEDNCYIVPNKTFIPELTRGMKIKDRILCWMEPIINKEESTLNY